jgi:hypothetical protein
MEWPWYLHNRGSKEGSKDDIPSWMWKIANTGGGDD